MQRKRTKRFFSRTLFRKTRTRILGRISNLTTTQILLVLGACFFTLWIANQVHLATKLSFSAQIETHVTSKKVSPPTHIDISSLNLSFPVHQTRITNGIWEVSKDGVSHLASSGYPDQRNNGIYYAHNTIDRFGKLPLIQKGDVITITTRDNKKYLYTVVETLVVKPTETDKLISFSGEMISIYTCTGFADSLRFLVKAQKNA